ncbi:MAG: hypothetical protein IJV94_04350 [Bacilli bacterium]|nr:hypothetical protein [Bacilli bacterium]MBQ9731314.1 hypothetical protein [Bacilli bacterium]
MIVHKDNQDYDVETQLFWVSSRYYLPELCRWISPDSIEYLDSQSINGLNLYAYCGNDPINKYDPSGHIAISAALFIETIVVGALIGGGTVAYSSIKQGDEWYEVVLKTLSGAALGGMLGAAMGTGAALATGGTIAGLSVGSSVAVGIGVTVGGCYLCNASRGGMWMDKRIEKSNRLGILKIKTNISLYRALTIVLSILSIVCGILYLTHNYNWIVILIFFLIGVVLLLMTIFMSKIVEILNLPLNYLLITKKEILYKKGKKQFIFKIEEIKYEFHSFFEDFESLSQLIIFSRDDTYYVNITKKQFNLIEQFLN